MTIQYRDKIVQVPHIIKCDKCGKIANKDIQPFEYQNYLSIETTGHYGSKCWGDNVEVKVDFCEECAYEILSSYAFEKDRLYGKEFERIKK